MYGLLGSRVPFFLAQPLVPRNCEQDARANMHLPAKLNGTGLLILGGFIVLAITATRLILRTSKSSHVPAPRFDPQAPELPVVMPVRDPFTSPPKPPAIVQPRPSVRGEAAIALVAIGAYVAVFGASLFGGSGVPDLLDVRPGKAATVSEVLSIQVTPTPPAATTTTASAPAMEPAPAGPISEPKEEPTPEPTPERPSQHVLRAGETLTSVAALYGVTAYDLAVANSLTSDRVLAGQVLRIPAR